MSALLATNWPITPVQIFLWRSHPPNPSTGSRISTVKFNTLLSSVSSRPKYPLMLPFFSEISGEFFEHLSTELSNQSMSTSLRVYESLSSNIDSVANCKTTFFNYFLQNCRLRSFLNCNILERWKFTIPSRMPCVRHRRTYCSFWRRNSFASSRSDLYRGTTWPDRTFWCNYRERRTTRPESGDRSTGPASECWCPR